MEKVSTLFLSHFAHFFLFHFAHFCLKFGKILRRIQIDGCFGHGNGLYFRRRQMAQQRPRSPVALESGQLREIAGGKDGRHSGMAVVFRCNYLTRNNLPLPKSLQVRNLQQGLVADQEQSGSGVGGLLQELVQAMAERAGHALGPIRIFDNSYRQTRKLRPEPCGEFAQHDHHGKSIGGQRHGSGSAQKGLTLMLHQLLGLTQP